jgi:hypothetical protein
MSYWDTARVAPRLVYRSACPVVTMRASGRGPSGLRRIAAAVAESAGRAGRPGPPPIPGVQPRPGGYTAG